MPRLPLNDRPAPAAADAGARRTHIPGEAGVWVLIVGDLIIFAAFFLTFLYYRLQQPDSFVASQNRLHRGLGLVNTAVLITSSLLVAVAVRRARAAVGSTSRAWIGAVSCGVIFIAIKIVEYSQEISAGVTFSSNTFFNLYFAYTGIHLAHVVVGTSVLLLMLPAVKRLQRGHPSKGDLVSTECAASFWHLVDVLWLVLYSLLYLI
jgi:nitric oxide reductase NorE protein